MSSNLQKATDEIRELTDDQRRVVLEFVERLKNAATTSIATFQEEPINPFLERLRSQLVSYLLETGFGHFEMKCSIVNRVREIVKIEITADAKYSFTVSRRNVKRRSSSRKPGRHHSFVGIGRSPDGSLSIDADAILNDGANRREGWSLP